MATGPRIVAEAVTNTVPNSEGEVMYGVLTSPAAPPSPRRALMFSQAGLQNKGGVGDYFRWLADALAAAGYDVLRFDQRGTGDSPGEILEDVPLEDYFIAVQSGASTEDTRAALKWLEERLPEAKVYLWGQCGGAVPSLATAADHDRDVAGVMLLALPVLYSRPLDAVREGDARVAGKGYLLKLMEPRSYLRFLGGKSDYRLIKAALRSVARRARRRVDRQLERFRPAAQPDHALFNDHFWEAFREVMARRIPVLCLMAEVDNETPEFNQEFKAKVLNKRPGWRRLCAVRYIPDADHSLMFPEARERSLQMMLEWLEQYA